MQSTVHACQHQKTKRKKGGSYISNLTMQPSQYHPLMRNIVSVVNPAQEYRVETSKKSENLRCGRLAEQEWEMVTRSLTYC